MTTPARPAGPADALRFRDAHHDRVLLVPTAETHPSGSFYLSDYEIVLVQVGFAPTDRTQITLTGAPPLGEDGVLPLDISAKTVVLRAPRVSLAILGSASGVFGLDDLNGFLGRVGGAVTLCEPAWTCRVAVSLATNVALIGPASIALNGIGASFRLNKAVSLLAEIDSAVPLGPVVGEVNGILGGAGVRLSKPTFGLDLGGFVGGKARARVGFLPWIAFTYRTL